MRIHLPLHPHHFAPSAAASTSSSPLVKLGGDLVLIELQGELSWEGDRDNGVVGVIGLDRPDKPTLHLGAHHLLHGKFVNLQKPYAVIRKAVGEASGTVLEGDASEEEAEFDPDQTSTKKRRLNGPAEKTKDDEEEEDEPPLFEAQPHIFPSTPSRATDPASSSPFFPDSGQRDYSSELDPASSPARWDLDDDDEEAELERERRAEEKRKRAKAKERLKRDEKERTRHYEVVGIVRKKVVFALRPEPIVTATILPD